MIKEKRDRGMSISYIAEEMGISRPTVRKYLKLKRPVEYDRKNRVSILEPYKAHIKDRINKYNLSAVRILEEIRKQGYTGEYTILKDYCRTVRKDRAIKAVIRYECKRRSKFVQNRRNKIDPPHITFHSFFSPLLFVGNGFFLLSFSLYDSPLMFMTVQ